MNVERLKERILCKYSIGEIMDLYEWFLYSDDVINELSKRLNSRIDDKDLRAAIGCRRHIPDEEKKNVTDGDIVISCSDALHKIKNVPVKYASYFISMNKFYKRMKLFSYFLFIMSIILTFIPACYREWEILNFFSYLCYSGWAITYLFSSFSKKEFEYK